MVDRITGVLLEKVYFGEKSGRYYRMNRSIYNNNSKITIFGSSRANRNYIPSILSAKTGLDCYNAGVQGQGIIFSAAIEEMLLKRFAPDYIILNIDPEMLRKDGSFYDRLSDLLPYYDDHKDILAKYIELKSKYAFIEFYPITYRYNSKILHLLKYYFMPQIDYNGYLPLYGSIHSLTKIDYSNIQSFYNNSEQSVDTNCVNVFELFIKNAIKKKSKLIFCISPSYLPIGGKSRLFKYSSSFRHINSIASKYKVPIIDFSDDPSFILNKKLFFDSSHLNKSGAVAFSQKLADSLNEIITRTELLQKKNESIN